MPIVLGDTTITGLAAGGLPAGTVNSTTLADAAVISSKLADGSALASKIDVPYQMVVRTTSFTIAANGYTNIPYNLLRHSRLMSHNSNIKMVLQVLGSYLLSTALRFGGGGDVWTGCRMLDENGTVRGFSYGTGQLSPDPGPCRMSFIATIPANRVGFNMRMQLGRLSANMPVASPNTNAGDAVVTTVVWCGQ
jgi:hypothetical protein